MTISFTNINFHECNNGRGKERREPSSRIKKRLETLKRQDRSLRFQAPAEFARAYGMPCYDVSTGGCKLFRADTRGV